MSTPLRSRQQTRAAILSHLLIAGDSYRSELVKNLQLTEASISRIIAELKADDLVEEYARRPAPYPGGPTNVVSINREICVAGIEISNGRVSVGVGTLGGVLRFTRRGLLGPNPSAAKVLETIEHCALSARFWAKEHQIEIHQVVISLPGHGALGEINTIVPASAQALQQAVARVFIDKPLRLTNSVQAQAALHGFGAKRSPVDAEHLFLFVGHGVGAARVGNMALGAEHRPVEIGHMVLDLDGPRCRCGHAGCLEAYTALPAVAEALGISEDQLLADGDEAFAAIPLKGSIRKDIESMLRRLGLALGNTINVDPVLHIVVAGWPSLVPDSMRSVMLEALDASVLGGAQRRGVQVSFIAPSIGNDPLPALCYAAYSFVQRGAVTPS